MSTVNSRFLTVGVPEPDISSGWTIRVLDYKDMKSLVAVISDFREFSFTQELNGVGQGSVTLDEDSPFWTALLRNGASNRALMDNEYVFEAWDNNTPRFSWLGQTVTNTIVGEDETRAVVLAGPGIAQVLSWAPINRPGWPTTVPILRYDISKADGKTKTPVYRESSYNDKLPAFLWEFPVTWSTMRMWYTVFTAAQRRGLLKWVTLMFTALKDSGGQPWILVKTEQTVSDIGFQPPSLSATLLEFLNDCTGQDYSKWFGQRLEWIMHPGFKLDVRRHIGVDRSKNVRFFQGNIISEERTRDREAIYNRVIATDVEFGETIRTDKKSVASWNMREQRNESQKEVTNPTLRAQIADRFLLQSKDQKDEWSIKIPYDDPGRVPYRNFFVGDHVGVNAQNTGSTPTAVAEPASYRVMAITISVSSDSVVPECELTLQSLIDSKQAELEKKITELINNPRNFKLGDLKDISIPPKPSVSSALVWNPVTKKWEALDIDSLTAGGGGTGGGDGTTVFIQATDPGVNAKVSDFWYQP